MKLRVFVSHLLFLLIACNRHSPEQLKQLKQLTVKLSDKDSKARNAAALSIASYGADGAPAVEGLIRLLRDPNGGVRSSAAYALRSIDTEDARVALDNYKK